MDLAANVRPLSAWNWSNAVSMEAQFRPTGDQVFAVALARYGEFVTMRQAVTDSGFPYEGLWALETGGWQQERSAFEAPPSTGWQALEAATCFYKALGRLGEFVKDWQNHTYQAAGQWSYGVQGGLSALLERVNNGVVPADIGTVNLGEAFSRMTLTAGLTGAQVLEIGPGDGQWFSSYPVGVNLLGIEPDQTRLDAAAEHARRALPPGRAAAICADAAAIPAASDSYDAVTCSLALCSTPSVGVVLGQMARVLRPDGVLRFYEHLDPGPAEVAKLQATGRATCALNRNTLWDLAAAGFDIGSVAWSRYWHRGGPGEVPECLGEARLGPGILRWKAEGCPLGAPGDPEVALAL